MWRETTPYSKKLNSNVSYEVIEDIFTKLRLIIPNQYLQPINLET